MAQVFLIEKVLNKCNLSFLNFKSILDFGCGWGRLLRIFIEFNGEKSVSGCDVNKYYIMSLKKTFKKSQIFEIPIKPPYKGLNNKYDFIIAFSVFTHLTEKNHIRILKELGNSLQENGCLMITVSSENFIKNNKKFRIDVADLYQLNNKIKYNFFLEDEKLPEYGNTLISKDYIYKNWEKYSGCKIIYYEDNAFVTGFHDVVVLQKLQK